MKLVSLLFLLKSLDVKLSLSEEERLKIDAPSGTLTPNILTAIKQHKRTLISFVSPCRYCGSKLIIKVAPTWFEIKCPLEPCHFLIEEHAESFGATIELERGQAA